MTFTNNKLGTGGNGLNDHAIAGEKIKATLKAILANADPATWYPDALKVKSSWEPFDLCDLRGSDLSNQKIGEVMMAECALDDADFSNAQLDKTSLQAASASRAKFTDSRLHRTQMIPFYGEQVDFSRAVFSKVALSYAKLFDSSFTSAKLDDVSLSHTDFSGSSLVGAQITASRFDRAVLSETDLSNASFADCNLIWASFQHAQMSGTVLQNCDMSGADFRGANLAQAKIRGGKFSVVQQGDLFTPTRFDDTPDARKLVAESGAVGIETIEWAPVNSIPAAAPKRVMAGEPCTRDGFWFTPASTTSRKYFTVGQTFPEVNSEYGATLWQWDQNQDPPKLHNQNARTGD